MKQISTSEFQLFLFFIEILKKNLKILKSPNPKSIFFSKIGVSIFFFVFHRDFFSSRFRGTFIFSTPSCPFCTIMLFSSRLPTTTQEITNNILHLCNLHLRDIFKPHIHSLRLCHILKYLCRTYRTNL